MNKTELPLAYKALQDGTLAVQASGTLMLVSHNRYKALVDMEELYKNLDERQHILEQERKNVKKENDILTNEIQKLSQKNAVLQKKLTEYNCVVGEIKELRKHNTQLLIELSKHTALSKEKLSDPLKSMIRDLREQGVGIKEIHIRIKRQINPEISYSMVRKYISELECENKE